MVDDPQKLKKIKELVALWYKVAPLIKNKYEGRPISTYKKKHADIIKRLKSEIHILADELKLTNAEKFRILVDLI